MKTKTFVSTAAVALLGLAWAGAASAAFVEVQCDTTPGAVADGDAPLHCASGDAGNGAGAETASVNALWGPGLAYIGKYDKDSGKQDQNAGFDLSVGPGSDGYGFSFSLTALDPAYVGATIDFVLFTKQGNVLDYAYYWTGLVLNVDGFFNSFNTNDGNDYSHITGFVRITDRPPFDVPEPGALALLGLGLVGFGVARRRLASR